MNIVITLIQHRLPGADSNMVTLTYIVAWRLYFTHFVLLGVARKETYKASNEPFTHDKEYHTDNSPHSVFVSSL